MAVKGATTAKKTNVATEVILGQGAQLINKAVGDLKSAASLVIDNMESKSEELTLQITNKTEQIEALDGEYKEKLRQKNVDLDIQFKQDSNKVVTEFLTGNGQVAISKDELATLKNELETTKTNAAKETAKEVAIATNSLKSNHEAAIKLLESEHKGANIENTSKITALEAQNKFLEGQLTKLYEQLDSERDASIERAKAGAVGAINVNGAGK